MKKKGIYVFYFIAIFLIPGCVHRRTRTVSDLVSYGVHLAQLGCWDEATIHWKLALKADPDNFAALNNLAVAAENKDEFGLSKQLLTRSLQIKPTSGARKNLKSLYRHLEGLKTNNLEKGDKK